VLSGTAATGLFLLLFSFSTVFSLDSSVLGDLPLELSSTALDPSSPLLLLAVAPAVT